MATKSDFIAFMRDADVLRFGEFVTKSGRQSPYFVNTGLYRTGAHISKLAEHYAQLVAESGEKFDALFGPAYKGIPLVAVTAAELYRAHGIDTPYFFNRKETKDHGEGGNLVGYAPKSGDRVAIIEDVVTAGTAVRESIDLLTPLGVTITALFVSVDRAERGTGAVSALQELRDTYNISVYPIVTARDILENLEESDRHRAAMERYLAEYGA
ncbi:MAG: orotate phosphoribosyltransferase [Oscillospiraceae bacterium]|jgi:orotate phosphoribosyltransferase|nr:orotate phosphoribosyltransferase [Oscillospiraceae bacterium]